MAMLTFGSNVRLGLCSNGLRLHLSLSQILSTLLNLLFHSLQASHCLKKCVMFGYVKKI